MSKAKGGKLTPAPEYVGETEAGIKVYSSPLLGRGEVIMLPVDPYDKGEERSFLARLADSVRGRK